MALDHDFEKNPRASVQARPAHQYNFARLAIHLLSLATTYLRWVVSETARCGDFTESDGMDILFGESSGLVLGSLRTSPPRATTDKCTRRVAASVCNDGDEAMEARKLRGRQADPSGSLAACSKA